MAANSVVEEGELSSRVRLNECDRNADFGAYQHVPKD
jgi:hypothetical protein